MNEQTVLHRIYRECVDSVNDIWRRVSFWTQAVDVDLRQGETVQYRLDNLDLDSTKSKTLIEEYIEEAAEQHRLLTAQLDRLEDEIAARIPGLGMLSDTYKIIADANPEAATLYESRLAEAREEIAAMIKPVEDELERLRGLLSGAISNVEEDPLSDDILQKIQALRTKTDNDVANVNTNYIGEGFDPGVKAIGNSLTEAILNQEFNIHSVGAKFWEFYGFLGDEVVSSEDLYELETVDGMNVLDFLSGSYVNIDYNRKLNLCYIRGWVKIPFSVLYTRGSNYVSVSNRIDVGSIGLRDIFPKTNIDKINFHGAEYTNDFIQIFMGIRYACLEYSNGFIYKINSYLSDDAAIEIANFVTGNHFNSWDYCNVAAYSPIKPSAIVETFIDSSSSAFGDEGEGSDTSTPEYVWVYFEDGYFDNAYIATEDDNSIIIEDENKVTPLHVINDKNTLDYLWVAGTLIRGYDDENSTYEIFVYVDDSLREKLDSYNNYYSFSINLEEQSEYEGYLLEIGQAGATTYTEYNINNLPPSSYCHKLNKFYWDYHAGGNVPRSIQVSFSPSLDNTKYAPSGMYDESTSDYVYGPYKTTDIISIILKKKDLADYDPENKLGEYYRVLGTEKIITHYQERGNTGAAVLIFLPEEMVTGIDSENLRLTNRNGDYLMRLQWTEGPWEQDSLYNTDPDFRQAYPCPEGKRAYYGYNYPDEQKNAANFADNEYVTIYQNIG